MMEQAIPPAIRKQILENLSAIEKSHAVEALVTIESGSRAWGFASQDSDFDVRMIYMHRPDWYWNVQEEFGEHETRGSINIPISGDLDIAGWDLKKALGLLYKSNPPLFEWLRSPIVYKRDDKIAKELLELSAAFYSHKSAVYHYLHMAEGNFRQYLQDKEEVKRKKYLYVIRPVLACRWIEGHKEFPPMEIDRTLSTIETLPIYSRILNLIADKKAGTELGLGPADKELENFLGGEITRLTQAVGKMEDREKDIRVLNSFFRSTLQARHQ